MLEPRDFNATSTSTSYWFGAGSLLDTEALTRFFVQPRDVMRNIMLVFGVGAEPVPRPVTNICVRPKR